MLRSRKTIIMNIQTSGEHRPPVDGCTAHREATGVSPSGLTLANGKAMAAEYDCWLKAQRRDASPAAELAFFRAQGLLQDGRSVQRQPIGRRTIES